MKNRLILFCFCLSWLLPIDAFSQRYKEQIFDLTSVSTHTYHTNSADEELKLDVYTATKDTLLHRPVILFVHGGGFAGGRRDNNSITPFMKSMARRGYVAVSMSYTLTMKGKSFSCDQAAKNKMSTFKTVGEEIGFATAFLIQNKDKFNLDPEKIVIGGSSAGAEAVAHAAYWDETGSGLKKDFRYAGVIIMAGAIADINWISEDSAIPTQLFHGTCDSLVPYGTASHHYCDPEDTGFLMLYGAASIAERLNELNKGYYLVTGCNGGHEWNDIPLYEYFDRIIDFMTEDVLMGKTRMIHEIVETGRSCNRDLSFEVCGGS